MTRLNFRTPGGDDHRQVGPDSEQLTAADLGITSGPFADADVIFSYGTGQAVEDGILTDIIDWQLECMGLPVTHVTIGVVAAAKDPDAEDGDASSLRDALAEIVTTATDPEGDRQLLVCESVALLGGERVWLEPNEVGGYTVLLPSEH